MTQTASPPDASARRRRIILVDADHRVRDGLADLIGLTDGIDVIAATGRPSAALDATRELEPDVVIIDPRLPDIDAGLSLIVALRVVQPGVRIIVLCSPDFEQAEAVARGADFALDTCVDGTTFSDALLAAIRSDSDPTIPSAVQGRS